MKREPFAVKREPGPGERACAGMDLAYGFADNGPFGTPTSSATQGRLWTMDNASPITIDDNDPVLRVRRRECVCRT